MVFDDHGMRHSPSVRGYQGWALGVHINDSLRLVLSMQPSAVFINAMQCLSMQAGKQGSCGGKCDGSDASMKGNRKCHGNHSPFPGRNDQTACICSDLNFVRGHSQGMASTQISREKQQ